MDSTPVLILIQISALCHGYTFDYDYDPDILTNIAERITPRNLEHDPLTQNKRVLKVVPFTGNKKWKKKLVPMPPDIHEYKDIPIAVIVSATKNIPDENTYNIEDFNHTEAGHTNDKISTVNKDEFKVKSHKDNTSDGLNENRKIKSKGETKIDNVKSHKHNASEDLNRSVENRKIKPSKFKGDSKIDDDKSKAVNTDEVKVKKYNASEDLEHSYENRETKPLNSKESNGNENNLDITDDDTKIADDNDMEDNINDKMVLIDTLNNKNEVNEIVSIKTVGDKKGKVNKISIDEPIAHYFDDFKVEIQKEEPVNVIRSVFPKSKDDDADHKTYNLWFIFNK